MRDFSYPFEVHGLFTVCPRYRYDAFAKPELRIEVEQLFAEACEHNGMKLLAIGVVSDHVHLLIRFNASLSPGCVMRLIKGRVSRPFRESIPRLYAKSQDRDSGAGVIIIAA